MNKRKILFTILVPVVVLTAFSGQPGMAQEGEIEQTGHKLTLQKIPEIENGTAFLLQGSVGTGGDRYYVEHLTMFQPAMVILMAADAGKPVNLNLSKYRFDQTDWSGQTDARGAVAHQFRTQGELKMTITPAGSEQGADYFLIVWAADLPKPDLPPPTVLMGSADADAGMPLWQMVLAGLGLLVVAAALLRRKRGSS